LLRVAPTLKRPFSVVDCRYRPQVSAARRHVVYERLGHPPYLSNGIGERLKVIATWFEGVGVGFDPDELPAQRGGQAIAVQST
jgi:hypothetical protein